MNDSEDFSKTLKAQMDFYLDRRREFDVLGRIVKGYLESTIESMPRFNHRLERRGLPLLHDVSYRIKDNSSLKAKLTKVIGQQENLENGDVLVEDYCGVRLIFYFKDDMERFLEMLPVLTNFGQSTFGSIDRKLDEYNDRFGYRSVHFTITVTPRSHFYSTLRERDQQNLLGLKCEVQVRTILQHAWAEAAHNIVYKSKFGPSDRAVEQGQSTFNAGERGARRLWNALSATLELLDNQLVTLKPEIVQNSEQSLANLESFELPQWAQILDLYVYRGRTLPYVIVHRGSLDEIETEQSRTLFDVDVATGYPGYKDTVWEKLVENNRWFVDNLNQRDAMVVRVEGWDEPAKRLRLQPATYSDQLVTNHTKAHEVTICDSIRVSSLAFSKDGQFLSFDESPFANSIGASCIIRTCDPSPFWIVGRRIDNAATFAGQWSCPVSGALEWRTRGAWQPKDIQEWLANFVKYECERELGLDLNPGCLKYLGFAREVGRLGKPQFFFLIDLNEDKIDRKTSESILSTNRAYTIDRVLSRLEPVSDEVARELVLGGGQSVQRLTGNVRVSEELVMNLALALEYLRHKESDT